MIPHNRITPSTHNSSPSPFEEKEKYPNNFSKAEQNNADLSDRGLPLVLQPSLTVFADGAALVGLIHRIHTLGLGTGWDRAQHFTVGFTATPLTRRNLKHKPGHPLTPSLYALLECATPRFSSAMLFPSHLFPPHSKTNGFCGLNNAESKTGLLQNYRTTAGKKPQNKAGSSLYLCTKWESQRDVENKNSEDF